MAWLGNGSQGGTESVLLIVIQSFDSERCMTK